MKCKVLLNGLIIAFILMLSASSVWAVCCIADITGSPGYPDGLPDGAINAWDYGALKQEWGRSGCVVEDCETPCITCQWPCYESGYECLFSRSICYEDCINNVHFLNFHHLCDDICLLLDMDPSGHVYCESLE